MPVPRLNPADHPAIKAGARVPTQVLISILVVLVTAGGFAAARSGAPERDNVGADDVTETPLPTPVPLETGTPLPTPVPPMEQGSVVDTAVTWWGAWLPDEVTDALNEIVASRSRSSTSTSPRGDQPATASVSASPSPSPEPAADEPPPLLVPLPLPTPLPTLAPLPTVDLPLPTPTFPPLLP